VLVDAHAHLDLYGEDLDQALLEIEDLSIFTVTNSMDPDSYGENLEIAARSDLVLATFGVHPWNAPLYVDRLEELDDHALASPALGEIGLDRRFVEDDSQYPAQREVFEFFLAAASGQKKLVNLHTAGAEEDVLDLLDLFGVERAVVHWYTGPVPTFRRLVDRGTLFTFGPEVAVSEHVRALAREIPLELLLTETDNPGGPKWLTGEPGRPRLIRDVVDALAEIRETSADEIERAVEENLRRLLLSDPRLAGACTAFTRGDERADSRS
jgi:TatD DNase family protein